jgi:hypothetical protein
MTPYPDIIKSYKLIFRTEAVCRFELCLLPLGKNRKEENADILITNHNLMDTKMQTSSFVWVFVLNSYNIFTPENQKSAVFFL